MGSKDKLKEFKLEGVVQVSPEGDLDRELGHGSYGSVVEMCFRGLKCAGKKFYRDLYCGGDVEEREIMITRCHNECLLLCSLSHPNIVQFLGTVEERGSPLPILVMEFVPFTLSSHLKKHGIFPQEISYGVLVDVATGLCYLHGKKPTIIHRDLSANNILLTSEMRAKITDLGLAKILNATPAQSRCPGTAAYMPPEALVQHPEYRTEIDTFSYGVLIIHVLCGEWPHPDKPKRQQIDGTLVACSEYERRKKHISMLDSNSPMILLIKECLSDNPTKRPNAEAILGYVQGVASKCPRKFDSVLVLLKQVESLTYQLRQKQKQQEELHRASTERDYECDKLQSKLKHSQATYSQLKLELEGEKQKYINKESQYKTMQSMKREADTKLDKKSKLLGFKEKMVKAQAKQIKAMGSELKLQYKQIELFKEQLAFLKQQITAMEKQLHLTEEMIDDEAQADPKQKSCELEKKAGTNDLNEIIETQAEEIKALRVQIKVITEENEAASRVLSLNSQVESLQAQVDCLNSQLEQIQGTDKRARECDKRNADEMFREKELSESLNLELDILKNCQIRNLEEEVNEKESYIMELLLQQERAQSLFYSKEQLRTLYIHKEQMFLKFKFMRCPNLPMAMSDVQCAVVEDKVYVGGGIGENESDHAAQSQVFEYNLAEKKWRLLSQNHVRFFGLINFLGKVVSVGGMLATNAITGDVSVFDFAENCWSLDTILPMPTKRFHATVISHGECLAVCGGVVQGGSLTDIVEVLINEQWYKAPRLPYRICLAKSVVADHSCYIVGGAFSLSPLAPSNALISIPLSFLASPLMSDQNEWKNHRKRISDSNSSNYYPAIANHGGILLMLGGWSHKLSTPTSDIFAFSSEADMWVKAEDLPEPRCRFTATSQLQNGAIMLIGGVEKANKNSSAVLLMSQKF